MEAAEKTWWYNNFYFIRNEFIYSDNRSESASNRKVIL